MIAIVLNTRPVARPRAARPPRALLVAPWRSRRCEHPIRSVVDDYFIRDDSDVQIPREQACQLLSRWFYTSGWTTWGFNADKCGVPRCATTDVARRPGSPGVPPCSQRSAAANSLL